MSFSNYHSHCTFCDGRSSMAEFVHYAIAKGLKRYGFSSHAPLPFDTFWNMRRDDFPEYIAEFKRLKAKHTGEIELYVGLEVDYIHNVAEIRNDLFNHSDVDYLIGSVHYTDPLPNGGYWCIDGGFEDFNEGLQVLFGGDIRAAAERFFEISSFMIAKGGFDIVGHFDKISLNGSKCKGFDVNAAWYRNRVGELLQQIKTAGLMVEVNTKSFVSQGITFPDVSFYSLINELEIPIMVNSDCHYPSNVTDGFGPVFGKLKKAGFSTLHQLMNDRWQPVEFDTNGLLR